MLKSRHGIKVDAIATTQGDGKAIELQMAEPGVECPRVDPDKIHVSAVELAFGDLTLELRSLLPRREVYAGSFLVPVVLAAKNVTPM